MGRGPDQRFNVIVIDHFFLQEGIGQLERRKEAKMRDGAPRQSRELFF